MSFTPRRTKPCGHKRKEATTVSVHADPSPQDPRRYLVGLLCHCGIWKEFYLSHDGKMRMKAWGTKPQKETA